MLTTEHREFTVEEDGREKIALIKRMRGGLKVAFPSDCGIDTEQNMHGCKNGPDGGPTARIAHGLT